MTEEISLFVRIVRLGSLFHTLTTRPLSSALILSFKGFPIFVHIMFSYWIMATDLKEDTLRKICNYEAESDVE